MLTLREVGIVAQRELLRNVRSSKGAALFAIFLLGGFLPAVGQLIVSRLMSGASDEESRRAYMVLLSNIYKEEATVKHLLEAPVTIYVLFEGTMIFLPLFVLLIGFDSLSGELQHRTLRYSAARASRSSILVGKAVGIWALFASMLTLLNLVVWLVALWRDPRDATHILAWGPRFLFFACVAATAYVGFTALMSTIFRTPNVALYAGGGLGLLIWILNWRLGIDVGTERFTWLFPNRYESLLVLPDPSRVALGLGLLVVWGAVMITASWLLLSKRDI